MKFHDLNKLQYASKLRYGKLPIEKQEAKVIKMETVKEIIAELKTQNQKPYIFYVHPEDRVTANV